MVALISTMRLDATCITTKMYTVVKSAVYWVRKSTAKTWLAWFRMKVLQVWPPLGSRDLTMYLRTVLVEWVTPSFKASSSAIRSSPPSGWSVLMRRMKAMCSAAMRGRPGFPHFQVQKR